MPFVNEYIPPDDVKKYRIEEISKNVQVGFSGSAQWAIDRERDIYFREVWRGSEDFFYRTTNHFYWKGRLIWVTLKGLSKEEAWRVEGERFGEEDPADPRSRFLRFRLVHWTQDDFSFLSPELKARRVEIIRDLKQALDFFLSSPAQVVNLNQCAH